MMKSMKLIYKLAEAFKYRNHRYKLRGDTLEVDNIIIQATSPDTLIVNADDDELGRLHLFITLNSDDLREVSKAIYRLIRVYKDWER